MIKYAKFEASVNSSVWLNGGVEESLSEGLNLISQRHNKVKDESE